MNPAKSNWLTPTEAAVVSGVAVRNVHRTIDEKILPATLYEARKGGARKISADGCVLISFYFGAANRLTAEERLRILAAATEQMAQGAASEWEQDWPIRQGFLSVDLTPFLLGVRQRLARLDAARALMVEDPEILNGTPVIRGTRIPVYDVAASVAAGFPVKRILGAYSSLTPDDLELAALYADAIPARGRPNPSPSLPIGAIIVSYDRIPRKKGLKQAS